MQSCDHGVGWRHRHLDARKFSKATLVVASAVLLGLLPACGARSSGARAQRRVKAATYSEVASRYAGTTAIRSAPAITGVRRTDEIIRGIAVRRGYRLTRVPTGRLESVSLGTNGSAALRLQRAAADAWTSLFAAATTAGIPLRLVSAHRSVAEQRDLFMTYFLRFGPPVGPDAAVAESAALALRRMAPPGYSRHHTGYTIDVGCGDRSSDFASSVCYQWLKRDGFGAARAVGWRQSYDDRSTDGPDPEAWELIWFGADPRPVR